MKKPSNETIIRTVVLLIALVNNVLTSLGKNPLPFSEDDTYNILSLLLTVGASLWAWWKNQSFTAEAQAADEYMKVLKNMGKDEVDE